MISVESRDLRRFTAAMQGAEKEVKRDLNKRIRTVAEPIAREVRNAALQLPTGTDGKRQRLSKKRLEAGQRMGLRAGLAAATEIRQRSNARNPGVRIVVSRSQFARQTGKAASLPRYVEGLRRKPWRHPVFAREGRERVWVVQKSRAFLLPTVLPYKDRVRSEILDQFEDTVANRLQAHGLTVQ